jgi:hypothetical protein
VSADVWTPEAVKALGVRTTVEVAGSILGGLSRTQSYIAVQRGKFPVPVLRVGRRMVVPVQPILVLLGLDEPTGGASAAPPVIAAMPSPKGNDYEHRTSKS